MHYIVPLKVWHNVGMNAANAQIGDWLGLEPPATEGEMLRIVEERLLRQLGLWVASDSIDATRNMFEAASLREAHENGIEYACPSSPLGCQQAVVLLGNRN